MSEPQPERTAAAKPPPGRKVAFGMTQQQLLIVGGIALAGIGWLLWRRRKAARSAQSGVTINAGSPSAGTGMGTCPDGSSVDCSGLCPDGSTPQGCPDYSGQLATLQSEIGNLQGALSGGGGGGTAAGGGDGTSPPPGVPGQPTTVPAAPNPPSPAAGSPPPKAGAISNLQATRVGKSTAHVQWNPATGATGGYSYKVTDLHVGRNVHEGVTHGTSVDLSGLASKTSFNFGVQALPGGPGDNIHFTTT